MKYSDKKQLANDNAVYGIDMYTPKHSTTRSLVFRTTSGTSGPPTSIIRKVSYYGDDIEQDHSDVSRRTLRIKPNVSRGLQFGIKTFFGTKQKNGDYDLYLGSKELQGPYLKDILAEFKPDFIHASPGLFNRLLLQCGLLSTSILEKLAKVRLSGEIPSKTLVTRFISLFPSTNFSFSYGMAEFGKIGLGCPQLTKEILLEKVACTKVHPNPLFEYEIINKDTAHIGELVISKPGLKHYRTGDMGKMEHKKCSCGKELTLTIYGRYNYDVVHCVGATLYTSYLKEIFNTLSPFVKDFLAEVRELHTNADLTGEITLIIVPTKKLTEIDDPKSFIGETVASKLFVTKTRTLAQLIQAGIFLPPVVTIVDSLPQGNKKIYLRKIID